MMLMNLTLLVIIAFVVPSYGYPQVSVYNAIKETTSKIEAIEIMVSDCSHCGMSPLGQIHVKVN